MGRTQILMIQKLFCTALALICFIFSQLAYSQNGGTTEGVQLQETVSIGASNVDTVAFPAALQPVAGDLYLTAITTKPLMLVEQVSGFGLLWTRLQAQCSARGKTGIEVWMARGTPVAGTVTAVLSDTVDNVAMALSRYSGVDAAQPIATVFSGNSLGVNAACEGGVDNRSYAFQLTPSRIGSVVYAALAKRNRNHQPGAGFTEIEELISGASSGKTAGMAVINGQITDTSLVHVEGSFSRNVDWAAIGFEIRPAAGLVMLSTVANPPGSGSVFRELDKPFYSSGEEVEVTAAPASGYEFVSWSGDIGMADSTTNTIRLTLDAHRLVIANFREIPPKLFIDISGAGEVQLYPPAGSFEKGLSINLTAVPEQGWAFAGWQKALTGYVNPAALNISQDTTVTAIFLEVKAPYPAGIWTSSEAMQQLPMFGLAWENLRAEADKPVGQPNISDKDDSADERVLAKALVFAGTGESRYRDEVVSACMAAIGTEQGGRTLALGRHLISYVISADLVKLPVQEKLAFSDWLRRMLDADLDDQTLRITHENRPNNWGTHAGASRAAVAAYLGDMTELARTALVLHGWLGARDLYSEFKYGELDWQADSENPVGINPVGATKNGHSIDGVLPDDQRRAGAFAWPPPKENYAYEALQGILAQAVILNRYGFDVWNWQEQAILRAFRWLYNEADFPANNDDTWQPYIINQYYNSNFRTVLPAIPGKNVGWTDWLFGGQYGLKIEIQGEGEAEVNSVGVDSIGRSLVELRAHPKSGAMFSGWGRDFASVVNPDTVVLDTNKTIIARFHDSGVDEFMLQMASLGAGTIESEPEGAFFLAGTPVSLRAVPDTDWEFHSWRGDLTGFLNPDTILLAQNMRVQAVFTEVKKDTQTVFSFVPTHDTHVNFFNYRVDYGSRANLRVRFNYRSFLKFDVQGISGTIRSARLRLFVVDASSGGDFYLVDNAYSGTETPWDEDDLTWMNAPDLPASPFARLGNTSLGSWVEVDVTEVVKSNGLFSFAIKKNKLKSVRYSSKEGANPPQLIVQQSAYSNSSKPLTVDLAEPQRALPEVFYLLPTYPNPFNLETRISYTLATVAKVRLAIYNIKGQLVRLLADQVLPAGEHHTTWNGHNSKGTEVASGVYFLRLEAEKQTFVRRLILQK